MTRFEKAIRIVIHTCLNLNKNESLLIVIDEEKRELGLLLKKTASRISHHVFLLEHEIYGGSRNLSSPRLKELLMGIYSVIFASNKMFFPSEELRVACHHGARVLCISNISNECIERCVNTDFNYIAQKSNRIADLLTIGKTMELTTPAGTELTAIIKDRSAVAETGIVREPGMSSSLPSGKASISPHKRKVNGILVVDGSMGQYGLVKEPVRLEINNGHVNKIYGKGSADILRKAINKVGVNGRKIVEIGIGTNPNAELLGISREDERVHGIVHIVLGDQSDEKNHNFENNQISLTIKAPTVDIDNHLIVVDGMPKV